MRYAISYVARICQHEKFAEFTCSNLNSFASDALPVLRFHDSDNMQVSVLLKLPLLKFPFENEVLGID